MAAIEPHDLDAEGVVLSMVMLNAEALDRVRDIVTSEDFYSDANRQIYAAALALDARGDLIDAVSIAGYLRSVDRLSQVGGTPYLIQITDMVPATAHFEQHALTVARHAKRRRVRRLAISVAIEALDPDASDVDEWAQSVEARVFEAVGENRQANTISTAADLGQMVSDEILANQGDEQMRELLALGAPISTGLQGLDRRLGGGLRPGTFWVVAGRPGMGKTSVVMGIATHIAQQGIGVHFCSLEMYREQVARRFISQVARVNMDHMLSMENNGAKIDDRVLDRVLKAIGGFKKLPITIDDRPKMTMAQVASSFRRGARQLLRDYNTERVGMLIVDYLQIMNHDQRLGETETTAIGRTTAECVAFAKKHRIVLVAISQFNRDGDTSRPKLSDLRGSGAIEQDAFGVISVYREDEAKQRDYRDPDRDHIAELGVLKVRAGGSVGVERCRFDGPTQRFFDDTALQYSSAQERRLAQTADGVSDGFQTGF
jgi:replicative DNA helicase